MIQLRLLGSLALTGPAGEELPAVLRQPKRLALLAYLAVASPRGFHRRDTLLALFWPERDTEHARAALSHGLYTLRRTLGEGVIVSRGDEEVGIDRELCWCDAVALEEAVDAGRLEEAIGLYRGELLAGFHLSDAPEFDRWLEEHRARPRDRVTQAALALADQEEAGGRLPAAARWARYAVGLSPYEESGVRRLMALLERTGNRAEAVREYERFAQHLASNLEVEPSAETVALMEGIRTRRARRGAQETPSRLSPEPPATDALIDASETSVGPRGADAASGRTPASRGDTVRVSGWGTTLRAITAAGIILVAAGMFELQRRSPPAASAGAGPRQTQLTFVGDAERQEISPDGQLLAYVERGDSLRVFVKDLAGGSVIPVATLKDIVTLRWSPDGSTILCVGEIGNGRWVTALYPRLGGTPRLLSPSGGGYKALSPGGARLASWNANTSSKLVITTLATEARRSRNLSENLGWLDEGDWSPNGRWIALLSGSTAGNRWMLWDIDPDTEVNHEVVSDTVPLSAPRWSPAGDALYYLRDQNELRKIAITPQGVPRGAPETLQTGLGATHFSLTADGTRLAYTKVQHQTNLWLATLLGAHVRFATTQLTRGTAEKTAGHLSPDGRLVAFLQKEGGRADVYVIPAEGGVPRRVTSTGTATMEGTLGPAWSPDGRHLAFLATHQGKNRVHTAAVEGGDERIYQRTEASEDGDLAWAPQERILYQRVGNRNYHWLDPETETEEPLVANDSVGWMAYAIPSSDRQHVAVAWNRRGDSTYGLGTYVISLRDASQTPVGPRDAWPIGWSTDNTSVYVEDESAGRIRRVPVHGGQGAMVAINPFNDATCSLTERPPGLVVLCKVDNSISDVWLVENFDPTVALRPLAR